jgi:hypothetical protein
MAVHLRLRTSWQFIDSDPKNQFVINPCFRVNGVFVDANALCEELATKLDAWPIATQWKTNQLTVTSYDIEGTKPVYPNGRAQHHVGAYATPICDPVMACCLSFYSDINTPRRRGRLYLPATILSNTAADFSQVSVNSAVRSQAAALVPIFAGLGGANVDWIVWSGVDHAAHQVNNYFIDDSWDHVRSRKLKSTARTLGTTSG